jgi:hypothetical protein
MIQQLEAKAMRRTLVLFPLMLCATPALAQTPAPAPLPATKAPLQLTDPATADKLANAMQAMSKALLDLPVGVQAALEGRQPTPGERKLTVRDLGRRDDPNFDRNFRRQIAQAKPAIERSMKALNEALPAIMKGLDDAGRAIDRAAANMPDPTYPKR